ncbi:MAG: CDP-diacylglycerol--serine O-phosphatidyltransferase [Rickettsiales bacterium]|nr:CDP-diacylglycerol--serine O-phosphatidyltransferase [Rickettsiales bacterium]
MVTYNNTKLKKKNIRNSFPFYKLVPNIITIVALCFGLTAIKYALNSNWEKSLLFLVISAFLDAMDGRIARYLNATTPFGANLDSLADFVDFGIAPVLIMYMWTLADLQVKALGWGGVLIFAICGAIRLARFNVSTNTSRSSVEKQFFTGVPITVGAILAILPMMISFEFPNIDFVKLPAFNIIYLLAIAFVMASKTPTFSIKNIHVSKENIKLLLVLIGTLIVLLIVKPWITLIILCVCYITSIPISIIVFYRKLKEESQCT